MAKSTYDEASVKVLKGLEPVKHRPGMYTRTESPLHIVQEVIDNAADEALGGYASLIEVVLYADGSAAVRDDGRGIPVGLHPEMKIPTVEVVYTQLHAGGKFDKKTGGAYAFSGGLHGVGVSVTNALSKRLEVAVRREGKLYAIAFADGFVVEPLREINEPEQSEAMGLSRDIPRGERSRGGARSSRGGTWVRCWPHAKYFDSAQIPVNELARLLRAKAVLLPGVTVTLHQEKRNGERDVQSWCYPEGFSGYLEEQLEGQEMLTPLFQGERHIGEGHEHFAPGEGASWALCWTGEGGVARESYVNLIPTSLGGTHETGLREGVFLAMKSFLELHNLLPKGVKPLPEDLFARASFVLSAKVLDPQFQGQTKERLSSRDALRLVSSQVRDPFELWLNEHLEAGKRLAELVIQQAQARQKAAKVVSKRKSSGIAVLPGKLTDCLSDDMARRELFLVEGESAGGSAKMGRDKDYQAILPLRGKVLNTWEVDPGELFANTEIHDVAVAIGVDPHSPDASNEVLAGLRYGKILIMSDADVDGSHIQVLLLTLFCRHFPRVVQGGHLHIAQPPLFRVDVAGGGKNRPPRKLYALDEGELEAILDKLRLEKIRESAWSISRFKGLGEMNAEQLFETTMNPDTRRMLRIDFDTVEGDMRRMMSLLMGKGEASARRSWLEQNGHLIEADV